MHGQQMTPVMNDKLTIKYIPLSVSNDEVKRMLEENGVSLTSQIKYGLIRDSDGQQTTFKSDDRFVYIKPFNPALPRNQKVGNYSCVVIHHGKEIPCVVCGVTGHKVGDLESRLCYLQKLSWPLKVTSIHFPTISRVASTSMSMSSSPWNMRTFGIWPLSLVCRS